MIVINLSRCYNGDYNSERVTHLQSKILLAAVELQQLLSTSFCRLHGTTESRVEEDESRARHEVNEDDTEPEVDVEVDVPVVVDERREVDLAAFDHRVRVDVGRQLEALDAYLNEARQLRQQRRQVHANNHLPQTTHRETDQSIKLS